MANATSANATSGESASSNSATGNDTRPENTAADSLLLDARRAFVNNDSNTIAQAVAGFAKGSSLPGAGQHPLAEYPRYWQLVLGLRSSSSAPSMDAAVERFIESSSNRLLIDQLRGEWVVSLARRERWTSAREQGARLLSRDDKPVQCYVWLAEMMETGELATAAREHLLAPRELGEGCNPLLAAASARKQLSRDDLQQRLRLSAEAGAVATGQTHRCADVHRKCGLRTRVARTKLFVEKRQPRQRRRGDGSCLARPQ